jgi:hypothetical protein
LFGPTQTQVEHAQGDKDLPLLLPHKEPESESEDDKTLQDLVASRSSCLKAAKRSSQERTQEDEEKEDNKKEKEKIAPQNSLVLSLILLLLPKWIFYNTISISPLLPPMVHPSLLRQS